MSDVAAAVERAVSGLMRRDQYLECRADVNDGYCRSVAERAAAETGADLMRYRGYQYAHYWVRDGGRHYDAEAPGGVDDWWDLPWMRRHGVGPGDAGDVSVAEPDFDFS